MIKDKFQLKDTLLLNIPKLTSSEIAVIRNYHMLH